MSAWGEGDTIFNFLENENAGIGVFCNFGQSSIAIRFLWPDILLLGDYSTDLIFALYRFDRELAVQTDFFVAFEGGFGEFAITDVLARDTDSFLDALTRHDSLRVYVEDYTGDSAEAVFDIRGLANTIAPYPECAN